MRKLVATATAATAAAASLLLSAGSANALGGETLGCRIAPGTTFSFAPACDNDGPSSGYTIAFEVQNLSGSGYSFAWTLPAHSTVYTGCSSSDDVCTISVGAAGREYDMFVTVSQGGSTEGLDSVATIDAFCGGNPPQRC